MNIRNLFRDARFIGQAVGDRQTYSVFQTASGYLVAAPRSPNNYSVTFVQRAAPEVISRKFHGAQITVNSLKSGTHRPDLFGAYFDRLNALYVIVALGRAKKLKQRMGRAMLFKIK
jgi:hypothetical protein